MSTQIYLDIEDLVTQWLISTPTALLANMNVSLGMQPGSSFPCILYSRVGGSPFGTGNIAEDRARISFAVWGLTRAQAKEISLSLVGECESLGLDGGFASDDGILECATVLNWVWMPEGVQAKYVVDCLFTAITNQSSV